MHILVADDSVEIRYVLRLLLGRLGYDVTTAADGAEALAACRETGFELVLCDLFMTNREGLETIRDLRREFPALPVVALSGGGPTVLNAARLMGADAALAKPFGRDELLAAIEEALAAGSSGVN